MIKMDKTFKPPVRPSIEPKLTESAKLAADMAAFLAAGGRIQQVQAVFKFYDPQGRVPLVGTTAYRVLIALYRNALTTPPPKLKSGQTRVVNNADLRQNDIIKGVEWLRTWGWKIEEIRFESSAFIGYRLVR